MPDSNVMGTETPNTIKVPSELIIRPLMVSLEDIVWQLQTEELLDGGDENDN